MSDGLEVARAALAGRPPGWWGSRARSCLGPALTDLDLVVDGDPSRRRARSPARPVRRRASRCRMTSAPGAWSHATEPGKRTWSGCGAARCRRTCDCAISRERYRRADRGRWDDRSAGWPGGSERAPAADGGPGAFADDPLRVLRLVRIAVEMDLEPEERTSAAARARAGELGRVSAERVFMELRRILASPRARPGSSCWTRWRHGDRAPGAGGATGD